MKKKTVRRYGVTGLLSLFLLALMVPGCGTPPPPPPPPPTASGVEYVVGYITKLRIEDNTDASTGEVFLLITTSDGAMVSSTTGGEQVRAVTVRHPRLMWHNVLDGDDLFNHPDPRAASGLETVQLESGRPWGIPIFAARTDELGDDLAISVAVMEDDVRCGAVQFGFDALAGLAAGAKAQRAEPYSQVIGQATSAILPYLDVEDTQIIGLHTNVFGKQWLLDKAGSADRSVSDSTDAQDGQMEIDYYFRKVRVPCDMRVRVTLNTIEIPTDLDDFPGGGSDVYVYTRVWNGCYNELIPIQDLWALPRDINGEDDRTMSSRASWSLHKTIWEGTIGPFVYLELAVWDTDDCDDEEHGTIFGLWFADDLLRYFGPDGSRNAVLQYTGVARKSETDDSDTHLRASFRIQILDTGGRGLVYQGLQVIPREVSIGEDVLICADIINTCSEKVTATAELRIDGAPAPADGVAGGNPRKEITVLGNSESRVCFTYRFPASGGEFNAHLVTINNLRPLEVVVTSGFRYDDPNDLPCGDDDPNIGFDDANDGVADGTVLGDQYADQGVVFEGPPEGGGVPVVQEPDNTDPDTRAHSMRNVAVLPADSEDPGDRRIRLVFPDRGATSIGAYFGGGFIGPDRWVTVEIAGFSTRTGTARLVQSESRRVGRGNNYFLGIGSADETFNYVIIRFRENRVDTYASCPYGEPWVMDNLSFCLGERDPIRLDPWEVIRHADDRFDNLFGLDVLPGGLLSPCP